MDLGPHANFIIIAYAAAALVVIALVAWILADHAAQRRLLADLEARGVTRRAKPPEAA
ncbi:MAG: heme exporter protein [Hyphomicrobiales bacterium]|jgi:heme exporter protein D